MKDFLVSIIVPVYNCQQFLDRCIKSILNQSYKNIEVIVVNDGSSDNSLSIAESFAQDDSRMKVFTKENGGPSSSRNYGLNKVSGEFITFVDADDYIDEYMIENMIDKVNEYNDTIIFCGNYELWKNKVDERILFLHNKNKKLNKEIVMNEIASGKAGLVCCKLFSSNIIKAFNIRFDENIKMCEDQIFFLEISQYAKNFNNIDKALYYYDRTNENSITIKYQQNAYDNQLYIQKKINEIFEKNKLNNIESIKIQKDRLRDGLWHCINNEFSKLNSANNIEKIKQVSKIIKNTNIEEIVYDNNLTLSKIDKIIIFGIEKNKSILSSIILFGLIKVILPIKNRLIK